MSEERIVREFPVELTEGDGRTIDARIVPYNKPTRVRDGAARSTWSHGFRGVREADAGRRQGQGAAQLRAPAGTGRGHRQGLHARGQGRRAVRHLPRAPGPDGDKALELVRDGFLTGISLEAVARTWTVGVIERVRAHLDKVSLCRFPAFEDSQVLAVREAPDPGAGAGRACPPNQSPTQNPKSSWPREAHPATGRRTAGGVGRSRSTGGRGGRGARAPGHRANAKQRLPRPWNGAPARFSDEQYQRSALVCRPGDDPPKMRCSLPVLEPNGDVNTNALGRPRPGSTRSRASPPPCAQLPRASSCACTGSATWRRRELRAMAAR